MVNWFIAAYLLTTALCMLIMLYIMQRQFKEMMRPRNGFTRLRIYLFISPTVIFLGLALGFPRLLENLYIPTEAGQNVRIVAMIIVLSVFSLSKLLIYTYKEKE